MSIEVTARHMQATNEMQDYARQKANAIMKGFPGIEHLHIILDVQKHHNIAEVVAQARNHLHVEARESSDNMRMSVDQAFAKAEKQLRKFYDKTHDHKPTMKRAEEERVKDE